MINATTNPVNIEILIHDATTKTDNWTPGRIIKFIPADDVELRVECETNDGRQFIGYNAAHPDCVRMATAVDG